MNCFTILIERKLEEEFNEENNSDESSESQMGKGKTVPKKMRMGKANMIDYLSVKHNDNMKLKEKQLELEEKKLFLEEKRIALEQQKWAFMAAQTQLKTD